MVYIEMTKEEKTKGKAAVDLMGSQIGKSGASLSLQAIFLVAGGLGGALPVIGGVYLVMCFVWLGAVGCAHPPASHLLAALLLCSTFRLSLSAGAGTALRPSKCR